MVLQHRSNLRGLSVSHDMHFVNEVRSQTAATPNQTRVRCGGIVDRLPFRFQQREEVRAEPIHVVEQNETRDLTIVLFQESFNRIGVRGDLVDHAAFKRVEVFFF